MNQRGYIALLAILIVSAATTAIALALLTTGIDSQRGSMAFKSGIQARQLASACAEEALQVLHDNTSSTASSSLSLSTGNCTYNISSTGSSTRSITTSGTVNSVIRKLTVSVTISSSSISIVSWSETT